ncbi:hypothetical protein B0A49_01266, partial [Cryomyces minteri]
YRIRLNVLGPQKRKKRAWVWAHGVDVLDTKDDNLWLCKYCYQQKKKIKTYISTATNHVVEHLFKNHRIDETGLVEMKANEDIGELLQRQKKQRMPLLIGAHSGENIAGLVKNVIKDYRVGTILLGTDSDCFEDGLPQLVDGDITEQIVDEFEQVIQSADEIKKVEWWRKKGPVGKLHNLVVHIMWTPQRRQLFRSKQQDLQATKLLLLTVNGGIRWNSTHDMIERALQLKDAIDLYVNHAKQVLETADIVKDELTLEDWQELTELRDLLQPMKETTKRLEGNAHTGAYGALWESLGALDFLLDHLEMEKARLEHLPSSHFKACVNLGWKKLNYYYSLSDQTPAYRAAIVLHPRFKWRWFKKHWEKSHPEWIEEARKAVTELWQSYKRRYPLPLQSQKERSNFTTYMDLDDEDDSLEEDDEFERFCSLKTVRVEDPLIWWTHQQHEFPTLSRLAFDLLSVPAMSSECERLFSKAGQVLNEDTPRTKEDFAESRECLKSWLQHQLIQLCPRIRMVKKASGWMGWMIDHPDSAPSATTQVSPFYANYGFDLRMGFEPPQPQPENLSRHREIQHQAAEDFATRMERIRDCLRTEMQYAQSVYEDQANSSRSPAPAYKVGDKVWLNTRNIHTERPSKKLDWKATGPHTVQAVISPYAYELDLPSSMKDLHPVFHTSLLRPATDDRLPGQVNAVPPPVVVNGEEEWEVDEIHDSRMIHRQLQYLVKWTGDNVPSWQPASFVTNATDLLADFHHRYPNKPGHEYYTQQVR